MKEKAIKKICAQGHVFYKSSGCPVCPVCEQKKPVAADWHHGLSAPARRALSSRKIYTLKKLSGFAEKEILSWHGIGPASIPALRLALKKKGLSFKK